MSKLLQIYEWTNFPPILGLSKFVKHLKQIREEFFKNFSQKKKKKKETNA